MTGHRSSRAAVTVLAVLAVLAGLLLPAPATAGVCTPLSDAQVVAQLIGAPLRGPAPDEAALTLAREHAGTVVLLGAAIESADQVRGLVDALDAAAPTDLPPLIAVDEEGGRVARFGRSGVTTRLPSARQMAATMTTDEVRAAAADLGRQMASLGVDWDLAPVLDMTDADASTVIGDRSFSSDPAVAGAYATAFAEGLQQAGLVTNGKHFPDHGLTAVDTHTSVARVEVSVQQILDLHLQPYRQALPSLDSIMLSHLRVSSLDPELPATLSPAAVQMVRSALDFDGAIVTDDLSMQAVASIADQPTAGLMAVQAGVDVLLVGTPEAAATVHARLSQALASGELDRERLRQAARRALALKGIEGERASCLIGLPPVAASSGLVDADGTAWLVEDGRRRALPDPETAAAHGADPLRYSDAERDSLIEGPPVASVRRFQPLTVGPPGVVPGELALARAMAEHGAGFVPGLVLAAGAQPWQRALAAHLSAPGAPVITGDDVSLQQRAVDSTVPEARIRVIGGSAAITGDRPVVRVQTDDPVRAGVEAFAASQSTAGAPQAIVVLAAEVDDDTAASLAPWLARAGTALLLTPAGSLHPDVQQVLQQHAAVEVVTVGLEPIAAAAVAATRDDDAPVTDLPADPVAIADHLHRVHGWERLVLHAGADHVLSGLPLLAEVSAIPVRASDAHSVAAAQVIAAWRLPASTTRIAYGFGVQAEAHASLGLPAHHDRPGPAAR